MTGVYIRPVATAERSASCVSGPYCLKRKNSKVEIQEEEIDKIVWLPLEEAFELIKSGRTKFPKNYDYSKIFEKVKEIYYGEKDIQRGEQI